MFESKCMRVTGETLNILLSLGTVMKGNYDNLFVVVPLYRGDHCPVESRQNNLVVTEFSRSFQLSALIIADLC